MARRRTGVRGRRVRRPRHPEAAERGLTSFLVTVLVEAAALALGFREFRRPSGQLIAFLANLLTHPLYRFARESLFPHERWLLGMAALEPVVFVAEALLYARFLGMPIRRASLASLLANGSSVASGLASRLLLG